MGLRGLLGGIGSGITGWLDQQALDSLGPGISSLLAPPQRAVPDAGLLAQPPQRTVNMPTQGQMQQWQQSAPLPNIDAPQVTPPAASADAAAQAPSATQGLLNQLPGLPSQDASVTPDPAAVAASIPSAPSSTQPLIDGLPQAGPPQPARPDAPQKWAPDADTKRQMRGAFISNFLANASNVTRGGPATGTQQYRQDMLTMLVAQHKAQEAQQQQQVLAKFSQSMNVAGNDPEAQRRVLNTFAPYIGSDMVKAFGDIAKDYRVTPKTDDVVGQPFQAVDPADGQTKLYALTKSGNKVLVGGAPQGKPVVVGGSLVDPSGKVIYGSPEEQAFTKAVAKYGNDPAAAFKAYADIKGLGKNAPQPTAATLAVEAAKGDPVAKAALELIKPPRAVTSVNLGALTPQALENFADVYHATGQLPAGLGMGGGAGNLRVAIANRAGEKFGGMDLASTQADFGAVKNAMKQQTALQSAVQGYENTALNSLQIVQNLGATVDRSNVPLFNKWKQASITQDFSQDPNLKPFNNAISTFASEYAKLMSGAAGGTPVSDSARKEAMERMSAADSPATFQNIITQMRAEMGARKQGLADNVNTLQQKLQSFGGGGGGGAAAPVAPGPGAMPEGTIIRNKQTNQRQILRGGVWQNL